MQRPDLWLLSWVITRQCIGTALYIHAWFSLLSRQLKSFSCVCNEKQISITNKLHTCTPFDDLCAEQWKKNQIDRYLHLNVIITSQFRLELIEQSHVRMWTSHNIRDAVASARRNFFSNEWNVESTAIPGICIQNNEVETDLEDEHHTSGVTLTLLLISNFMAKPLELTHFTW